MPSGPGRAKKTVPPARSSNKLHQQRQNGESGINPAFKRIIYDQRDDDDMLAEEQWRYAGRGGGGGGSYNGDASESLSSEDEGEAHGSKNPQQLVVRTREYPTPGRKISHVVTVNPQAKPNSGRPVRHYANDEELSNLFQDGTAQVDSPRRKDKPKRKTSHIPVPTTRKGGTPVPTTRKGGTPVPTTRKGITPVPAKNNGRVPVPTSRKEWNPVPTTKREALLNVNDNRDRMPSSLSVDEVRKEPESVRAREYKSPGRKISYDVRVVNKGHTNSGEVVHNFFANNTEENEEPFRFTKSSEDVTYAQHLGSVPGINFPSEEEDEEDVDRREPQKFHLREYPSPGRKISRDVRVEGVTPRDTPTDRDDRGDNPAAHTLTKKDSEMSLLTVPDEHNYLPQSGHGSANTPMSGSVNSIQGGNGSVYSQQGVHGSVNIPRGSHVSANSSQGGHVSVNYPNGTVRQTDVDKQVNGYLETQQLPQHVQDQGYYRPHVNTHSQYTGPLHSTDRGGSNIHPFPGQYPVQEYDTRQHSQHPKIIELPSEQHQNYDHGVNKQPEYSYGSESRGQPQIPNVKHIQANGHFQGSTENPYNHNQGHGKFTQLQEHNQPQMQGYNSSLVNPTQPVSNNQQPINGYNQPPVQYQNGQVYNQINPQGNNTSANIPHLVQGYIPVQGQGQGYIPVQGQGQGYIPVQGQGQGYIPAQGMVYIPNGQGQGYVPVQNQGHIQGQGGHGVHPGNVPSDPMTDRTLYLDTNRTDLSLPQQSYGRNLRDYYNVDQPKGSVHDIRSHQHAKRLSRASILDNAELLISRRLGVLTENSSDEEVTFPSRKSRRRNSPYKRGGHATDSEVNRKFKERDKTLTSPDSVVAGSRHYVPKRHSRVPKPNRGFKRHQGFINKVQHQGFMNRAAVKKGITQESFPRDVHPVNTPPCPWLNYLRSA